VDIPPDLVDRFASLFRVGAADLPLDEGAAIIAAVGTPHLAVDDLIGRLDELAGSIPGPRHDADRVCSWLFTELGFSGDHADYHDPRNSYLDEVLDRRIGIPITLGLVLVEVGWRVGLRLSLVGMPGHVLVKEQGSTDFIDAFAGGARLDARGAQAIFHRIQGAEAQFDPNFLLPMPRPATLIRMLNNLKGSFLHRGDRQGLVNVLRLRTTIPILPDDEHRELASALSQMGRLSEAATVLEDLAEQGGHRAEADLATAHRLRARLN
jgi:regulator of sirC expression with transglutaminase-like and TPR domain